MTKANKKREPNDKRIAGQDATRIDLVRLARTLGFIAGMIEDYAYTDEPLPVLDGCDDYDDYKATVGECKSGPLVALANYQVVHKAIIESKDLARSMLPTSELSHEALVALTMAYEAMGQPDVPAEDYLLNGDAEAAVGCIREAFQRACERSGQSLHELEARLLVAAETMAERKPLLTEHERQVLDIIAAQPEGNGISGRDIIAEVRHRHNRVLEQSTLSGRIIPRLKTYGVRNRPRVGYYVNRT